MDGVELEVVHLTRYAYSAPVSVAHHLAHLQPLEDAHQRLLLHDVEIDPPPSRRRDGHDTFGNACLWFESDRLHEALQVRSTSRVRVLPRFAALQPQLGPAWDELAARLRYVAQAHFEPAGEFTLPSPFVPRLEALRDWAAPSLPPGRPVAAVALELMHRLHGGFAYRSASTQVDTPLGQAFEQRAGVCQDFAHLLAGALRMWGLPARYVSGYLLTHAPGGGAEMTGADASHAWVQVWAPGTPGVGADGWLDLDPTNDRVPGSGHVRVAVGRDFGDVTPLRGVIRGGGRHALTVAVQTRWVDAGTRLAPAPV